MTTVRAGGCLLVAFLALIDGGCGKGSTAPTDVGVDARGLSVVNGYVLAGPLYGSIGTRLDGCGSTATLSQDGFCASGVAAKIPAGCNGWGAAFGMYTNQSPPRDGGDAPAVGVDLSRYNKIMVELSGAGGLDVSMAFELGDADAGNVDNYCATLAGGVTPAGGLPLSSLIRSCWEPGGPAFDPTTVRPVLFGITIGSNATQDVPFDVCIHQLGFD